MECKIFGNTLECQINGRVRNSRWALGSSLKKTYIRVCRNRCKMLVTIFGVFSGLFLHKNGFEWNGRFHKSRYLTSYCRENVNIRIMPRSDWLARRHLCYSDLLIEFVNLWGCEERNCSFSCFDNTLFFTNNLKHWLNPKCHESSKKPFFICHAVLVWNSEVTPSISVTRCCRHRHMSLIFTYPIFPIFWN